MSDLWLNQIDSLREDESIQGSFHCHLDFMKGIMVFTDQRMIFIQGGGRFNNIYTKGLEADYDDVVDVELDPGDRLRFRLKDDKYYHYLETIDIPTSKILDILNNYIDVHYYYETELPEEIPV